MCGICSGAGQLLISDGNVATAPGYRDSSSEYLLVGCECLPVTPGPAARKRCVSGSPETWCERTETKGSHMAKIKVRKLEKLEATKVVPCTLT